MAACSEYIEHEFPLMDDDLKQYVEGILENGIDEFEDSEEIYEAIGEVLHEISEDKTEKEIREICNNLLVMMNPSKNIKINSAPNKVLNAPVHLGSMAANLETNVDDIRSIWMMQRDDSLKPQHNCSSMDIVNIVLKTHSERYKL